MITKSIRKFLQQETASGIMLMVAAVAALVCANSPLAPYYEKLLGLTGDADGGRGAVDVGGSGFLAAAASSRAAREGQETGRDAHAPT